MTALPVIERDLRIKSRRWGTYWLRAGVGLIGVLVCVPQLISSSSNGLTQDIGQQVFGAIVAALFLVCCGACLLTADAISREWREETLGLLLLTRVRGIDMIVGKFGSSGVVGLTALAAFLPILMLPVLAGGVTGTEAVLTALALLNTLFFSLAAGLYASAVCREQVKAGSLAIFIVLAFSLVPWLLWLVTTVAPVNAVGPLVATICASEAFSSNPAHAASYTTAMVTVQVAGWALIGAARSRLGEMLRNRDAPTAVSEALASVREVVRRGKRIGCADPVGWAVCNQRWIRAPLWWATAIVVIYVLVSRAGAFYSSMASWLLYGVCSAGTDALLAIAAGRFFVENARAGQLELLMTTPVGATSIIHSQWRAFKKLLGWPIAIWISALMLHSTGWLTLWDQGSPLGTHPPLLWAARYVVTWFFDIVSTIINVFVVCWIGMWVGLRTRNRLAIAGWAAAISTGIPALFRLAFGIVVDSWLLQQFSGNSSLALLVSMWLEQTLVLIYFVGVYRYLQRRLRAELKGGPSGKFSFLPVAHSIR